MSGILPWPGELQPAVLLGRRGRFTVSAAAGAEGTGGSMVLHLPNSGRLVTVLKEGYEAMYLPAPEGDKPPRQWRQPRLTSGRLVMVRELVAGWVCTDPNVPPRVLGHALAHAPGRETGRENGRAPGDGVAGLLGRFWPYARVRTEPRHGARRFDLALVDEGGDTRVLIECKSITLVDERGVGLFPDAPTARGAAHLKLLGKLAGEGGLRTALVFMVGRSDARVVRPHREMDPGFGVALDAARAQGLEVLAFRMRVGPEGVGLGEVLEVVE
jgi:sugar fermentation stimulation protein A